MVVDELDALRDAHKGCQLLAFADLSTQMILVTDTANDPPREVLDLICAEAALMLGINGKVRLGQVPGSAVIVSTATETRAFLRAAGEPNDVLCCICAAELDVEPFLADARVRLDRISNG